MEIKKFKAAAQDLKENKGVAPEIVEKKAKRVIDSRILEKKEAIVLAELALEQAQAKASVDPLKVKAAQIQLASTKRSVENEKVIEVETLEEEFYKVWGKEDVDSMQKSFILYQEIKAVKAKEPAESSKVIAAQARLADLTEYPEVKQAEKNLKVLKESLANLEEFRAEAFETAPAE